MVELNQCTPNREQMWLLRAALQQGEAARQAWQQWRTQVNLDDVDLPSYDLLPLVYHNLAHINVDDALLGRLKGVYRHTWSKNHMLFHHAQEVVTQLAAAGIRTIFLHGAAMTIGYYQEANARRLTAVDILVPQAQFLDAVAQLQQDEWQLLSYSHDELRWCYQHQIRAFFSFRKGQATLNLHCRLLPLVRQDEESSWRSARCRSWHGQPIYLLNPTQQLFHTCVHAMTWSNGYLTWIPDALTILAAADRSGAESTIDWQALAQQAAATRQILPLYNTLTFLAKEFQAAIPPAVLAQLTAMPVTFAEKQEYKVLGTEVAGTWDRLQRILLAASRYRTLHRPTATPLRLSPTAWIPYLFRQWHLAHWWQLPQQLVVKLYTNWQRRRLSAATGEAQ